MPITLDKIPGLDASVETVWKVRTLAIDGRNPVAAALLRWKREHPSAFKRMMKVIRLAAGQKRVRNPEHVKKSANEKHGDVYEMIAYTDIARLMFFYDSDGEALIIITNDFEKGVGSQDAAFARCAELRDLYLRSRP